MKKLCKYRMELLGVLARLRFSIQAAKESKLDIEESDMLIDFHNRIFDIERRILLEIQEFKKKFPDYNDW